MFAFGLPFPQETDTRTTVRDSIRTLLGPRPRLNPILGSGGSGALHDIEHQKRELIVYRARIVALIEMLEGGAKVPGNEPVTRPAGRDLTGLRKPIAAARAAGKRHAA